MKKGIIVFYFLSRFQKTRLHNETAALDYRKCNLGHVPKKETFLQSGNHAKREENTHEERVDWALALL